MSAFIIAHDLGTTGNKATLYDRDGALVGSAFAGYPTYFDHPNWAEQDPNDWWGAICASTQRLLAETGVPGDQIACIVFSGQMMGCVPIDRHGLPMRRAIIWADTRSNREEQWLAERIDPGEVYRSTGHRLSASYSLTKMLWLRAHEPDLYYTTYKFVHAKDSIVARLTGAFVTDPSDASSMNLYDLEQGAWSSRMIEAAEIDPNQLPDIRLSTEVVGEVLPHAAAEVGVAAGTPVVIGGGDGACAAVGAGVWREGAAYNYIGSSSWIAVTAAKPIYDPSLRTFTFGHIVPGMVMPTGTMQAAGASYQWVRDQLGAAEAAEAERAGESVYERMNALAAGSPPGARGLLYLPYLLGERSPRWNAEARGAFIGLTMRHTRADLFRAALEGITLNLRVILDAFRAQGANIDSMRLIGGGAQGRFWNQLMADIYGIPTHRMTMLEEATSMGAAVAGGVGVGLYPGFAISEQMNAIAETVQPQPAEAERYAAVYDAFERAYTHVEPLFGELAAIDRAGEVRA